MRVLISGAGIAGPTLAWFLAKLPTRVTVLERSPSLRSEGHNIDVDGSAIRILEKMGVLDQVKKYNTTEVGTRILDTNGRTVASFPFNKGSAIDPTSEYEILRGDLATILYEASKDHSNVEYMFGTTVMEVMDNDQDGDSVRVRLSNGEVREFDLVVAADGQWSKLRESCFPKESVEIVDKDVYIAYCTIPRLPQDDNWWNCYIGLQSRNMTLRPDPHGTIRAMLTKMPCDEDQRAAWKKAVRGDTETQKRLLLDTYKDAGWQTERILEAIDRSPSFYFSAIQQVRMSAWSKGRVVCIGDAAFAPTPISGMGTTAAIHAAYILAGELSKLDRGEHPARALKAYESALRPAIDKIQNAPDYPRVVHPYNPWHRWLLQSAMWTATQVVRFPLISKLFLRSREDHFPLTEYPYIN